MNNKGNIMMNLLMFIMALGVMIIFIGPINAFLDIAQQSDNLNCKGFLFDGDSSHRLSFNNTLDGGASGQPIGCLALKLYLPYILLAFLISGLSSVLMDRTTTAMGFGQ